MHTITSAAVIYITHKSHEPIKYGFGGTEIRSGVRQNIFNVGKTLTSQYCLYENLGAPNFCAGAPKKKKLGAPVQPVQKVSLEPCN